MTILYSPKLQLFHDLTETVHIATEAMMMGKAYQDLVVN